MIVLLRGASILAIFAIAGIIAEVNNAKDFKEKEPQTQEQPVSH
ncbi:MAG: hypothetical protein ACOH5I_19075 [Oligoflexus sp.]